MPTLPAVILAGGMGERLSILSEKRAKPAVPFAGKYRIIDFTLSNCINSGIHDIIVLTQYQPISLTEHIGIGMPWGLAVRDRNIRLIQPYLARGEGRDWYKGTADAVYQNMNLIVGDKTSEVLILSGDHIYKMDYNAMLAFHQENRADATLAVTPMTGEEVHRFGTVITDESGRVIRFQEKVKEPESHLVSMGVYIFNTRVLRQWLEAKEGHDFGRNILPKMVRQQRIFAYTYEGYWRDIGTVESYWQVNMEILSMTGSLLADENWPVHTREDEWPPTKIGESATVTNSLLSGGCVIDGHIEHSIISPGVRVAEGALIKDSVIMDRTQIGRNSIIDRCILDKEITVGMETHIGFGDDYRANGLHPDVLSTGLTIVGKGAAIPSKYKIGRNCIIYDGITGHDLPSYEAKSGETVKRKSRRRLAVS